MCNTELVQYGVIKACHDKSRAQYERICSVATLVTDLYSCKTATDKVPAAGSTSDTQRPLAMPYQQRLPNLWYHACALATNPAVIPTSIIAAHLSEPKNPDLPRCLAKLSLDEQPGPLTAPVLAPSGHTGNSRMPNCSAHCSDPGSRRVLEGPAGLLQMHLHWPRNVAELVLMKPRCLHPYNLGCRS